MRNTKQAALGVLLMMAMGAATSAEETKTPWWRFGRGESAPEAAESAPTVSPAPTMTQSTSPITPIEEESWFKWPALPKFGEAETTIIEQAPATVGIKPRRQPTRFGKPEHVSRPRNTWAQQPASTATTESPSPWKSMTESTRTAWHKTVDWVTPGDGSEQPVVDSEPRVSWWGRMWGEEEKPKGPQTVTEWMAQDRLDP